jgi:hypothetical protein
MSATESTPEPPALFGPRAALIAFVALQVLAVPLMISWGRRGWFNTDDWDFLAARRIGNVGDLLRPHYGHWTTLPIIAYRALWQMFALRNYVPYLTLAILAHLAVAALLRIVMRRSGVSPWLSTLAAGAFLFFGSGAENVLLAFQITFVGALAFGLTQLILAEHDGPFGRRDRIALVAGFAALMCSGVALILIFVVGIVVLLRRGWRRAALQTLPLVAAYGIWTVAAPRGQSTSKWKATSFWSVFEFVGVGIKTAFVRLGQSSAVGIIIAALLIVGLVLLARAQGRRLLRGPATAPLALLLGAFVFLFMTGALRSGATGVLSELTVIGPDRARLGRYVYIVAALALPAIALALDAIIHRWRAAAIVVAAVLLIGVPGNVSRFSDYTSRARYITKSKTALLAAAASPLASDLPRSLRPLPVYAQPVTLGWLLDNRRTGRLPSLAFLTRRDRATATMDLALQPSTTSTAASCETLNQPILLVVKQGDVLTARNGPVVMYLLVFVDRSKPRLLAPGSSVRALAGPLRIVLTAAPPHADRRRGVVCLSRKIVPERRGAVLIPAGP